MGTNIRNVQDIFSVMWSSQRNHRRIWDEISDMKVKEANGLNKCFR